MNTMNIQLGGEFIYMASMLMKIKAQMLLPDSEFENDELEDPRSPLIQKMLEYKQFKEAGKNLYDIYINHSMKYKGSNEENLDGNPKKINEYLENITLFNLSDTFKHLIEKIPDNMPYSISPAAVSLDEQISFLYKQFRNNNRLLFHKLFPVLTSRIKIIVTFMAILELIRRNKIIVEQNQSFSELILVKV